MSAGFEAVVTERDILADLVSAVAAERDRQAFTRLFDHFAPRITAYLLRMGSDSGTAEEITQEVMVTLWRKAHLFDRSKSSVGTWLFRIARNRRIDLLRHDRFDSVDQADPSLAPEEERPLDDVLDARRLEAIMRDALAALPEEQCMLVRLAYFEGLSHGQIAERTDVPLGTVKSRIRLAFARLRQMLDARGIGGDRS